MKINKKFSALVLAATLACTTPVMVYAQDSSSEMVDQAVEILKDNGVDDLLSNPDKVVDLIMQTKEILGQVDVTDEEIGSALDVAAESVGVTLTDSDKTTLIQLYNKFKNTDLDEEQLRSQVNKVYNKLEELGITKEDVKGILGKLVDLARSILNLPCVRERSAFVKKKNEKIYKKHILYMPITEMIWYIPMSLLAFEAYIGSPALIKQSQFPYYENYYTVQGKVVSFERNGSGHTYRSILVLDNGNTYYIPPTLERNYGYEDWLLNKIHSDITSGKEVILQVLDFDNSDYTPAIMSLKCNGVEYFP